MKFKRYFVKTLNNPYEKQEFVKRISEIKNLDGSSASNTIKVIAPSNWSQVAVDILAQKYLRKTGVPNTGQETDSRQVFHRLAGCWMDWGLKAGYFDSDEDAKIFYDEACYMLANQVFAPNSPQWFNTGLYYAYGIKGRPQGHYYFDSLQNKVVKSKSAYERPQPHACFIQSIDDDLVNEGGIMDLWVREARLFKYGSGTGTNFSSLRGKGERLSGGGVSSGLMSFLKIGDRSAGAIKSGGTTRRAAKMVCLDLDHPDIEEFINWKVVEEQKVASLVTGSKILQQKLNALLDACNNPQPNGLEKDNIYNPHLNMALKQAILDAKQCFIPLTYIQRIIDLAKQGVKQVSVQTFDTDWNNEAYMTVSGQNSNNSIRVPNEFMNILQQKGKWNLKLRTTGEVCKTIEAQKLWNDICYAAWSCADPGVQFDDTINEWHTCPKDGKIRASNPCSEYMFLDDTACNLGSLNLIKFYNSDRDYFDVEGFLHAVRICTVILDISVEMAQFPSPNIAQRSWEYRTLGLGYANLGALLMQMAIPYGSDEALAITGSITAMMCGQAYKTSAEIAQHLGAFPRFQANKEDMLKVIRNHKRAVFGEQDFEGLSIKPLCLNHSLCPSYMLKPALKVWEEALQLGSVYGYRNAQVTVIAPTGTIGLLMDCDTTGIEPDYALVKFKKLAGGGYFKIINKSIPIALKKLGYSPKQIQDICDYCLGKATFKGAPHINDKTLIAKGFTLELLNRLEELLKNAFDISFVFNKWNLGEEFCIKQLKISKEKLNDPNLNILKEIGFDKEQIDQANEYICGTMCIEGAPHIKEEHLAVFDCANKCGLKGKRSIPYIAHIKMMAAAQPFISGAISKTINLDYKATIEDVHEAYCVSWKYMLKAIALYRDGSKLSQPLQVSAYNWDVLLEDDQISQHDKVVTVSKNMFAEYISKRRALPSKRSGYTQKVKIGGHSVYLRTGEYEDGKLGEIFLDINKEGTLLRCMMNCFAISVSLGLQYGVPLEEFVDTFTFTRFEPNGVVLGHDNIKFATSVVDFIFRDLAINYLDRYDLSHIKKEEIIKGQYSGKSKSKFIREGATAVVSTKINEETLKFFRDESDMDVGEFIPLEKSELKELSKTRSASLSKTQNFKKESKDLDKYFFAKLQGYEGDPCPECNSLTLVRNGACLKCETCGATTGCS